VPASRVLTSRALQPNFNFTWGITPETRCCGASDACTSPAYNVLSRNLTYMKVSRVWLLSDIHQTDACVCVAELRL
jgi:hypothetical protein